MMGPRMVPLVNPRVNVCVNKMGLESGCSSA